MSDLLLRVECSCGNMAAIPEGGFFPLCPNDGLRMMLPEDRSKVMAWVAEPMLESEAVRKIDRPRARVLSGSEHCYSNEELAAKRRAHGFPTKPPDWPRRTAPDGYERPVPPWEACVASA